MKPKLPLPFEIALGLATVIGVVLLVAGMVNRSVGRAVDGSEHLVEAACSGGKLCEFRDERHRTTCYWTQGALSCVRDDTDGGLR